jgi:hypothetical protein
MLSAVARNMFEQIVKQPTDYTGLKIAGKAIVVAIVGLSAMVGSLWLVDVHQDRKHTVTENSLTPVFAGSGQDCDKRPQLALGQPGATLRVRRIRYWKDCATLDVTLPDGQSGHIILGVGDVSIHPSLP